ARGGTPRPGSGRPPYPCPRRPPPGGRRPDRKLCSPPRWCVMTGTDVPRMFPLAVAQDTATGNADCVSAGQIWWGGWDSNPGPADYESSLPAAPVRVADLGRHGSKRSWWTRFRHVFGMIKVAACRALWPLVTDPRPRREYGRPEA